MMVFDFAIKMLLISLAMAFLVFLSLTAVIGLLIGSLVALGLQVWDWLEMQAERLDRHLFSDRD